MTRPKEGRMIAGVCLGLSRELHVDVAVVRLAFLLFLWFFGLTLPAYVVFWIITPSES